MSNSKTGICRTQVLKEVQFVALTIAETNELSSLCKGLGIGYEYREVYANYTSDGNYYPHADPCLLFPIKCHACRQVMGWNKVGPLKYDEAMKMLREIDEKGQEKKQGELL